MNKIKQYLAEIEKNNKKGKKINAMLQVAPIENNKAGKLKGKVIAVKANINVRGLIASCASRTLENYKAPYDATVIKKIKDAGGVILGMTNCDEFACGWSGEFSAFGPTRNPHDIELVAGGSSSGSAAAVAAGFCDVALGSDTGGSIRVPSSHCGVVGVKPTYGSVSRYGLIDMCMSFDQVGPIAKNVSDAALLLSVIAGQDERDAVSQSREFSGGDFMSGLAQKDFLDIPTTSSAKPKTHPCHPSPFAPRNDSLKNLKSLPNLKSPSLTRKKSINVVSGIARSQLINLNNIDKTPKNLKVGLIDFPIGDRRIQKLIDDRIREAAKKYGWKIEKVKIPHLELAIATYFPIVYTEFFSATRRFDGRRYGKKIEDVCGAEVLRRILGGSEITKAEHAGRYYNQALKVRRFFQKEFEKVFRKFDCVVSPVIPRLPHKIGEKITMQEMFEYDCLTCVYNLVGNCAMSLPVGRIAVADLQSPPSSPARHTRRARETKCKSARGNNARGVGKSEDDIQGNNGDGVPVGMQIACDKWGDELMLRVGRGVEKLDG